MSLPSYVECKESDVAWLGELPSHWAVKRLKHLGDAIIGLTYDPSEVVNEEDGTLVLRSSNVQQGRISFDDNVYVSKEISPKLTTAPGDILICSRNGSRALIGKNALITEESAGVTFGAFMTVFRSPMNKYLYWVFNSEIFSFQSSTFLTSTINQLTTGNLYSFAIPLPPPEEQTVISTFLDRETAKIDGLIAEQEKLIALLAEKRQATISHAVTKGLNPDAPMKDSGAAWLGKVAEHWNVAPLGIICSLIQTGPFGSQLHAEDYVEDGTPVVNPSNLIDGQIVPDWKCSVAAEMVNTLPQHVLRIGDIVFGRRGEMGRCALVKPENAGWLCGTGSLNLRLKTGNPRFVVTYLGTPMVRELLKLESVGSTMDNLNASILSRVRVPLPPEAEQEEIAAFLDSESSRLDALTAEATRGIALLKERRSALISAAVTGKIDVRHLAVAEAA